MVRDCNESAIGRERLSLSLKFVYASLSLQGVCYSVSALCADDAAWHSYQCLRFSFDSPSRSWSGVLNTNALTFMFCSYMTSIVIVNVWRFCLYSFSVCFDIFMSLRICQ